MDARSFMTSLSLPSYENAWDARWRRIVVTPRSVFPWREWFEFCDVGRSWRR